MRSGVYQSSNIEIIIEMPNSNKEASNQDLKDMDVLCTFKIKIESQNSEHMCTKDKLPYVNQDQDANPSQKAPASSKAPNHDLKDMDVLCSFKIKIESQNLEYGCTKDQRPYPNQYQDVNPQSGTSSILQSSKS